MIDVYMLPRSAVAGREAGVWIETTGAPWLSRGHMHACMRARAHHPISLDLINSKISEFKLSVSS